MRKESLAVFLVISILSAQFGALPPIKFDLTNGERIKFEDLANGGVVLIDYWALWCAPCLNKMSHLDSFQKEFSSKGLKIVAVNIDSERSISKVKSYIRSKGYSMLIAFDSSKENFRLVNGISIPYTILVNTDGKILYRHSGYVPGDETILREKIQMALKLSSGNS
ncbi:MAG: TlpA family protein disulfide reductase [Candidatus Neomarinimicrobiota bacterium]